MLVARHSLRSCRPSHGVGTVFDLVPLVVLAIGMVPLGPWAFGDLTVRYKRNW